MNQHPAGDADLGGQPRALGAERVLEHLHGDVLALGEDALDRLGAVAVVAFAPDVGHVQEGGAFETDIDERRLHARQHPHHLAEVDVADDAATGGAFDVEFLGDAVLHQRDAGFLRVKLIRKLFGHGGFLKWGMGKGPPLVPLPIAHHAAPVRIPLEAARSRIPSADPPFRRAAGP